MEWLDIDLLHLGTAAQRQGIPKVSVADVEQMRDLGPIVPVSVRPTTAGQYEILAGAETWLCAQRLGQDKVPVFIVDDLDDEQAEQVRPMGGQDPISEAEDFAEQLMRWEGAKRGRITGLARWLGLNRAYVAHALRLLRLPETIKDAVRQGRLSAGHARAVLRLPVNDQVAAARRMMRNSMSVREAEALVRGENAGEDAPARNPDVVRLEHRVSELLGCDFRISEEEGTCTIDYVRNLEILDGVLEKIGYKN